MFCSFRKRPLCLKHVFSKERFLKYIFAIFKFVYRTQLSAANFVLPFWRRELAFRRASWRCRWRPFPAKQVECVDKLAQPASVAFHSQHALVRWGREQHADSRAKEWISYLSSMMIEVVLRFACLSHCHEVWVRLARSTTWPTQKLGWLVRLQREACSAAWTPGLTNPTPQQEKKNRWMN